MDIDIASKLFPNFLTILTQLAATGIIYLLYRRFLHEPVMSYLDRQAEEIHEAQDYAEKLESQAQERQAVLEAQYQEEVAAIRRSQEAMREEAERERQDILRQANEEKTYILQQARQAIAQERQAMLSEVSDQVLDLAVDVSHKALDNYEFDEDIIYLNLERELERAEKCD